MCKRVQSGVHTCQLYAGHQREPYIPSAVTQPAAHHKASAYLMRFAIVHSDFRHHAMMINILINLLFQPSILAVSERAHEKARVRGALQTVSQGGRAFVLQLEAEGPPHGVRKNVGSSRTYSRQRAAIR